MFFNAIKSTSVCPKIKYQTFPWKYTLFILIYSFSGRGFLIFYCFRFYKCLLVSLKPSVFKEMHYFEY